jgi:hypothetical protein
MVNVDEIIAFEEGTLPDGKVIKMFQRMVNDGSVWGLQGFYGRTAQDLLDAGLIKYPTKRTYDYYGNPIPTRAESKKKMRKVM